MHVHGPQANPNLQFLAACAAQQAQRNREAAAVRKKLMEAASKLAGGSEDDTWSVRSRQENAEGQSKQNQERGGRDDTKPEKAGSQLSDWA